MKGWCRNVSQTWQNYIWKHFTAQLSCTEWQEHYLYWPITFKPNLNHEVLPETNKWVRYRQQKQVHWHSLTLQTWLGRKARYTRMEFKHEEKHKLNMFRKIHFFPESCNLTPAMREMCVEAATCWQAPSHLYEPFPLKLLKHLDALRPETNKISAARSELEMFLHIYVALFIFQLEYSTSQWTFSLLGSCLVLLHCSEVHHVISF